MCVCLIRLLWEGVVVEALEDVAEAVAVAGV